MRVPYECCNDDGASLLCHDCSTLCTGQRVPFLLVGHICWNKTVCCNRVESMLCRTASHTRLVLVAASRRMLSSCHVSMNFIYGFRGIFLPGGDCFITHPCSLFVFFFYFAHSIMHSVTMQTCAAIFWFQSMAIKKCLHNQADKLLDSSSKKHPNYKVVQKIDKATVLKLHATCMDQPWRKKKN